MTDYLFAYNFLQMNLQVRMRLQEQKTLNQLRDKTTKKKNKAPEKKYSDEDLNAILDKRFARWKADQEKEKAEAKRLAEMNAQERAEAERDKVQKS